MTNSLRKSLKLAFFDGELACIGLDPVLAKEWGGWRWNPDRKVWLNAGYRYRDTMVKAQQAGFAVQDVARCYEKLPLPLRQPIVPRPHQSAALAAWGAAGYRGVVSLPTGAGKTILAILGMVTVGRPTLVLVPTIDLLEQWCKTLAVFFDATIGALGGGRREYGPITVATYDSALLALNEWATRYGLLIFDECHHLPAQQYQQIARTSLAPFRLGLSATVERPDGREEILYELVGDVVYAAQIRDMTEAVLSPYDVVSIQVPLSDAERDAYQAARKTYLDFVRRNRIQMSEPGGWQDFLFKASRSQEGREALKAHRQQRRIAQGASSKLVELWRLLGEHCDERVLVFTDDNALAYQIGIRFILPVLTHQTKARERKTMLAAFRNGDFKVLVTSKVLNEGVDVPEASVGIVVSGSAGVREHVQRLGRILRQAPGKRAVLYELVSKDTSEVQTNWRRKQHHAYQRPSQRTRARPTSHS